MKVEMGLYFEKLLFHILCIRTVSEGTRRGLKLQELRKIKVWRSFGFNIIAVGIDFPDSRQIQNLSFFIDLTFNRSPSMLQKQPVFLRNIKAWWPEASYGSYGSSYGSSFKKRFS